MQPRQLRRAIRKLPGLQRTIFCEIRFEDLTYEEIAERHGLTIAEVEAVFARALFNFMRRLDWKPRRWWHRR
jgi:RNA polymerase sigma-70 factor (ECF subfamily)